MRVRADYRSSKNSRFNSILCLSAGVSLILTNGCGLQKPETPNWTIDLLVPIANRHIDGPYIAAHAGSDYLTWHNDSGLVWKIAAGLDTVLLSDKIRTTPPVAAGLYSLGSVVVGRGSELSCQIDLTDVTALAAGTVPELTTAQTAAFQQATAFDSLAGASGNLQLDIENELGVTVDQVTITLSAPGSGVLASFAVPGTIPSGASESVTHAFANITCGNDWTTTLSFHTPGGTVLSAADKFIAVHATFPEGITANYARAALGQTSRQYNDSLILSDTHLLSQATIGSGQLVLSWTNATPLPATIYWQSQDLLRNGSALAGEATFAGGSTSSTTIDLAGVNYTADGSPSSARVEVVLQFNGSSGQVVEVAQSQSVGYNLSWSEVTFASVTGQIAQTHFSTGTQTASLIWEDGLDEAGLDQWDAYLVVTSSLPLAAQLSGEVTTNTGLQLTMNGTVGPSSEGISQTRLLLQHGDTPLLPLPSEIQFSGTVTIGGGSATVSIDASDFVSASVEFNAPAHMYVDDVSLSIDPSYVTLSGEDYGDRTNRLLGATVTISVANRFPLGGQFTLRMASDSAGVSAEEALVLGPSILSPAVTDASGHATSVTTTELTYTLDSADLTLFEREVVWFSESLTLLGPGLGQPARISPADVLDWNAQARIEYRVDEDVKPWEN